MPGAVRLASLEGGPSPAFTDFLQRRVYNVSLPPFSGFLEKVDSVLSAAFHPPFFYGITPWQTFRAR